jgi:hypothetical protein
MGEGRGAAAGRQVRITGAEPSGAAVPWASYEILLGLVVSSVAVQGAVPPSAAQRVIVSVLLGGCLVTAFRIGRVSRPLQVAAWTLASAGVVVGVLDALTDAIAQRDARVMSAAVVAFAPPAVALGIVRSLRASREVRVAAVSGVLSLYMLLGMLFAFVYGAFDHVGGHPFFAQPVAATVARCLYFSFTTLTTVGYGDLTARTDAGHTLAVFEALVGQIYLVTVVSLIVSNLGRRAGKARDDGDGAA